MASCQENSKKRWKSRQVIGPKCKMKHWDFSAVGREELRHLGGDAPWEIGQIGFSAWRALVPILRRLSLTYG